MEVRRAILSLALLEAVKSDSQKLRNIALQAIWAYYHREIGVHTALPKDLAMRRREAWLEAAGSRS